MTPNLKIRPAATQDQTELARLLDEAEYSYHHLDWSPPLDWLGRQPFWVSEDATGIRAALAVIEDPDGIAWVRLYFCRRHLDPQQEWPRLFSTCLEGLRARGLPLISALGLRDWFTDIVNCTGFRYHQSIVTLTHDIGADSPSPENQADYFIRPMELEDLPAVAEIDRLAFEPIWQNSLRQIEISYQRAIYATVAENYGSVCGFQISTRNMFSTHLARLAVTPRLTRRRIGMALVVDLMERCKQDFVWQVTVNTQDNNLASLALYHKAGFHRTGEDYSVWKYNPG